MIYKICCLDLTNIVSMYPYEHWRFLTIFCEQDATTWIINYFECVYKMLFRIDVSLCIFMFSGYIVPRNEEFYYLNVFVIVEG